MENNKLIAEFMELKKGVKLNKYFHPVTRKRVTSRDFEEPCFLMPEDEVTIYTDRPGFEWQYHDDYRYLVVEFDELEYHSDWNWLMQVVDKIESIDDGEYDVNILKNGTQIINYRAGGIVICDNVGEISYSEKIEHVYQAVVNFIKWYEQNNN